MGQRALTDPDFGNWTAEHQAEALVDGDKRSAFVMLHMGHRFHHLYLWHLLDLHGIMSLVLTKLSPEVAMDTDNVHADTQQVQKRRRRAIEEEAIEKVERKKFRVMVGTALDVMAQSAKMDTVINRLKTAVSDMNKMENKIAQDESLVLDLRVKLLEAEVADNQALGLIYKEHLNHHRNRVASRNEELRRLNDKVEAYTKVYDLAAAEHAKEQAEANVSNVEEEI